VCDTLTDEYELDLGAKTQPSINIDDLLFSTYHLIAVTMAFPVFTVEVESVRDWYSLIFPNASPAAGAGSAFIHSPNPGNSDEMSNNPQRKIRYPIPGPTDRLPRHVHPQ
jgi:hypothetical protein